MTSLLNSSHVVSNVDDAQILGPVLMVDAKSEMMKVTECDVHKQGKG